MTSNFNELDFDALCERLCENKSTLIIYHTHSDGDAVGSAFALREIFRLMDIPAICACSDEVPERLRFLSDSAQGSVLIEAGMELGHERVISVDSASPTQLGDMFHILHKDIDLMIDHHARGTVYADHYIDASASATGEIIYEIAARFAEDGKIDALSPYLLTCIYAAISSDTGGFRYSNVTPRTHRIAAELIEAGIDAADINHKLFESKTLAQVCAEGLAIESLELYFDGRVACSSISYREKQKYGVEEADLDTMIEIPRSVMGVEVAFVVRQPDEKPYFRVSMRSSCDFDVSAICARFRGGGHVRAAGCGIEAENIEQAIKKILDAISEKL